MRVNNKGRLKVKVEKIMRMVLLEKAYIKA
jgi:hypothetical protein